MHQIRFWLGLGPRPHWDSLQYSCRYPLAGFKGPTFNQVGEEGGGKREGRKGQGGEGKGF